MILAQVHNNSIPILKCVLGRKIAIDASMAMYQFLIAVRSNGPGGGQAATQLTNEAGKLSK